MATNIAIELRLIDLQNTVIDDGLAVKRVDAGALFDDAQTDVRVHAHNLIHRGYAVTIRVRCDDRGSVLYALDGVSAKSVG